MPVLLLGVLSTWRPCCSHSLFYKMNPACCAQSSTHLGHVDAQVPVHPGAGGAEQHAQVERRPLGAPRPAVCARVVAAHCRQRRRQRLAGDRAVARDGGLQRRADAICEPMNRVTCC
jgi:hypothetical protein